MPGWLDESKAVVDRQNMCESDIFLLVFNFFSPDFLNPSSKSVLNIVKKVQEVVSSYIYRNKGSGRVTFGGKNTSIADRIRGKGGRLRNNCMGKRVNFTARTVITGDARMGMDEVGVPQQVADTLTITENINRFNIDTWQEKIEQENSPVKYVIRADEKRLDLRFNKPMLQIGWKVERKIQNGDIARCSVYVCIQI